MIQNTNVNGVDLAFRFDGRVDAPVLMMSNSLMSNLSMWNPQIEAFSESYQVLRYDTRGHGRSAAPLGPYSMGMLGEDAAALIDKLDLKQVHFCGLSMGGMVGQYLGANHSDKLKSLILCDTACAMPPASLWDSRILEVRENGTGAVAQATLERWFTKPFRKAGGMVLDKVEAMINATPVEGFTGCALAIRDMDQFSSLASIKVPTLIVVGRHDLGTPVSAAEVLHENIEGSELAIIEDAAHLCNMEQPVAFNNVVLDFLNRT